MATGPNASSSADNMSWGVSAPGPGAKVRSSAGELPKDVFDALEERLLVVAGILVELFLRQHSVQFLERVLLFFGELLRDRDAGDRVEIAVAAAVDVRHAFAAQLEAGARLRAGRHLHRFASVERRHVDRATQRECRKSHWHLAVEVVFFTMEEWMLLHVHDDIEVTRRTASRSVFSLAVQSKALSGGNAGGYFHREFALASHASRTTAGRTRLGNRLARAATVRTRPRHGEE